MINRLQFSIEIQAEKAKIWDALWSDSAYRDWASVFAEGSYALSENWQEGTTVHFLSPNQNGIYSIVETHVPNTVITFKHIGNVVKGIEQPVDDESKKWSAATESYTLTESKEAIKLTVDIDILDEHVEFMSERLPKALEKIKNNCR